jgi:hypothetical protein
VSLSTSAENEWPQIEERRYNFTIKADQVRILRNDLLVNRDIISEFSYDLLLGPLSKLLIIQSSSDDSVSFPKGELFSGEWLKDSMKLQKGKDNNDPLLKMPSCTYKAFFDSRELHSFGQYKSQV